MKLFISGAICGAGAVLLIIAVYLRASESPGVVDATDDKARSGNTSAGRADNSASATGAADPGIDSKTSASPSVETLVQPPASVSKTDESQSTFVIEPIEPPKDQAELALVLNQLSSATKEAERRDAMSRLHNYLVDNPEDLSVRLAIRNAASFDPHERVRRHGIHFLCLSKNEDDYQLALERLILDPSPSVKQWAIEKVAKASESKYWLWLLKDGNREEAKARHSRRRDLARNALISFVENELSAELRERARKALAKFPDTTR